MEIEPMNAPILGGLLGLMWAKNKDEEDAAYSRLATIVADLDGTFQDMQDVIVDHRDEAIDVLLPRVAGLRRGSPEFLREFRRTFRPWALRDRPVLRGQAQHLHETRTLLPFMPGWEHITPAGQIALPGRFDEVVDVMEAWLRFFDEAVDGRGASVIDRWDEANAAWIAQLALIELRAPGDGTARR